MPEQGGRQGGSILCGGHGTCPPTQCGYVLVVMVPSALAIRAAVILLDIMKDRQGVGAHLKCADGSSPRSLPGGRMLEGGTSYMTASGRDMGHPRPGESVHAIVWKDSKGRGENEKGLWHRLHWEKGFKEVKKGK